MKLVILESPFRGETPIESVKFRRYAYRCMLDSLKREESPLASHLLWPQILDDNDPVQRAQGIEAGLSWLNAAEAAVVYVDHGISPGMRQGIERAEQLGKPIIYRRIGGQSMLDEKTMSAQPEVP